MPRLSLPLLNARFARLKFSLAPVFAVLGVMLASSSQAGATTCSSSPCTITTTGSITASGQNGFVTSSATVAAGGTINNTNSSVTLELDGLKTTDPSGGTNGWGLFFTNIILQGPGGTMVVLGGVGNSTDISTPETFTVVDNAGSTLAPSGSNPANGGSYKPASFWNHISPTHAGSSTLPSGASSAVYPSTTGTATFQNVFQGTGTDGTWTLYISNSAQTSSELTNVSITGWKLTIAYTATASNPTTTSIAVAGSSSNHANLPSGSVTFTASVSGGLNGTVGNGTVTFKNTSSGANLTCTGAGDGNVSLGSASCTASAANIGEGLSSIEAIYNPGAGWLGSTSSTVGVLIEGNTTNPQSLQYCNTGSSTSPGGGGTGQVYPSIIKVPNLGNTVANLQLELKNISTSTGKGLRGSFLLVAPDGHNLDFFDEPFDDTQVSGVNINIQDGHTYPDGTATATSGTYNPTDNYVLDSTFPNTSPAAHSIDASVPAVPATATFSYPHGSINNTMESTFNTVNPQGDWALYYFRHDNGVETISGGWCIDFTLNTGTATTTTVASSLNGANQAHVGNSVTFTATVRDLSNNPASAGTVTFTENGVAPAGTSGGNNVVAINGSGVATFTTSSLSEGDHTIVANYSGSANFNESQGSIAQRVDRLTALSYSNGVISACNVGQIEASLQADGVDGNTGPFVPNPSNIFAAGLPGTLNSVSLSLNGFTTGDASPFYTEAMVAGPNGKGLDFFSGTDNSTDETPYGGINMTFSDAAASLVPQSHYVAPYSYKPTDYNSSDLFSASSSGFYPLPGSLTQASPENSGTLNGQFTGNDFIGNGTWSLFFNITSKLIPEKLTNGWCVNFTQNPVATTNALSHSGPGTNGDFVQGEPSTAGLPVASITFNLTNNGVSPNGVGIAGDPVGSNANPLKVVDTLPTGLTYDVSANGGSKNGTNWNCSASGQTVTCTNDASSVAVGVAYPQLTIFVDVASNAATHLTNSVNISGADVTAVNGLTDSITVDPPPSLSLTMAHTGTFTQSSSTQQTGEWDITVSDAAASGQTYGPIHISDTLPNGYTLQGSSSTNGSFTCAGSGASVTCDNISSGAVVAVGSPDTIRLTVIVPNISAATVTNSACAYGGGDPVHTSCTPTSSGANSNVDTVNVIQVPTTVAVSASSNNQSATILTSFANPLVVTIKDAAGVAIKNYGVSNGAISFTAPAASGTNATGTFAGNVSIVTPTADSNGQVSEPFTAGTKVGSYQVTVSAGTGADTVQNTFTLTNTVGAPASISVVSGSGQSTADTTLFTNPLIALVQDVGANPVPGATVTFTAPGSGASGAFSNSSATISTTTDSNGDASETFTANPTLGSYSVTAGVSGVPTAASFTLTNVVGPYSQLVVTVPPPVYAAVPAQFTVVAEDAGGNLVSTATPTLNFTSSDGAAILPPNSSLSAGTGTFTATLNTLGPQVIKAGDLGSAISGTSASIQVGSIPNLVVTVSTDDAGTASNCTAQTTPGTGTDASCSLRDALLESAILKAANISFDASHFGSATAINAASTLTIPTYTSIQGPTSGSGASLTNLLTVNGGGTSSDYPVFTVGAGIHANIANLIISNGNTSTFGGGISSTGTLTVTGSTISGNSTSGAGAGIYSQGALTVSSSTISGNTAGATNNGSGGGIYSVGTLSLVDSTVSGNTTDFQGGGVTTIGGSATISNSTISGNRANLRGGGIFRSATLTIANSVVAGNTLGGGGSGYADIYDSFTDAGGNVASADPSTTSTIDPHLAPLGSYGGPTQTMLPQPGSLAICGGTIQQIPVGVTTDQRGLPNQNNIYNPGTPCVDAGAVQTNYAMSFTTEPPANATIGVALSPAPVVTLTESGVTASAAGSPVTMTDSGAILSGDTTINMAAGVASFSNLLITGPSASDTLTATVALTGSLNLTAGSTPIDSLTAPTLSISTTHTGTFIQGQNAEWDVTVGNSASASPTSGTITMVDTLPAGYTMGSYVATGWSCVGSSVITCQTTGSLATGGNSTIALTVAVPANSAVSVSNQAEAWGGGDPVHNSEGSSIKATDSVTVQQVPFSIAPSSASFNAQVGTAYGSLAVTVSDAGGVPIANFAGPIVFTATAAGNGATGTFAGASSTASVGTDANGVADPGTFTANTTAGSYTVTVSLGSLLATDNMTNTAGAFSQLAVSGPANAFTGWPFTVTVTPEDQYGNAVSGFNDTLHYTSTDPGAVLPPDSTLCGCGGIEVTLNTVGPQTITATDTANAVSGTSNSILVAVPPTLVVTTAQDDAANGANCSPQTTPGTGTDAACSLRDALNYASTAGAGSISFDSTAFSSGNTAAQNTITLTDGPLEIPNYTSISGPYTGSGNTLADRVTVSGNNQTGVFQMTNQSALGTINGLAITGGMVNDSNATNSAVAGAGIYNDGTLTVTNSIISGNNTSTAGVSAGAGIFSNNDLEISNSTISGNTGATTGGGGYSYGGGIGSFSYVNATNLIVSGNASTANSGGYAIGGGIFVTEAEIDNSTISGNIAQGIAGGSIAVGGGIAEFYADALLVNDTISGNTASAGPDGIGGGIFNLGSVFIRSNTISGNTANDGGGMFIDGAYTEIGNTILSGNVGPSAPNVQVHGNFVDHGGNLIAVNVMHLAPLADNGGGIPTMLPLPGSPAICGGLAANLPSGTDERGLLNRNVNYPGFGAGTPCVDTGAVQTHYAIHFMHEPAMAGLNQPITPAPTVTVMESGHAVDGAAVGISASEGTLTGPQTQLTSGGVATFSKLVIQPEETNETLTATMLLNSGIPLALSTTTDPFNVSATAPVLVEPTGAGTLSGVTQFRWSPGVGATLYYLRIGTRGAGSDDLYQSGTLAETVHMEKVNIPANGATLYVRLGYKVDGTWQTTDYTFTEAGAATAPALTAPSGPTPLSGATQFTWSPGAGLTGFYLRVGTTGAGSTDIYHSGTLAATVTTENVTIPSNGAKLYVRLGYEANGVWSFVDYTFNEGGAATLPVLTEPGGPAHLSGATQFAWSAGTGGTAYYLRIGILGPGSSDILQSGSLPLTTTSKSVSIPANGATLYVRLGYQVSGAWQSTDYTFTEAGTATAPTLTAPSGPAPLSGVTQFTWSPGAGLTGFYLRAGTTGAGSTDLYHSGTLASTVTSESVTIPSNGAKVFVRLGYEANGVWSFVDYTFNEAGAATLPALTAPSGPAHLSGATQFAWSAGTGGTAYYLRIGTLGAGSSDVLQSGSLPLTTTSKSASIPTNGATLYVRLGYQVAGAWQSTDYTFTEAGAATAPALTAPSGPTPLSGATQFTWSPGAGLTGFYLRAGTTGPGTTDLYHSGTLASTVTSESVTIPSNGARVYVRLGYEANGVWSFVDYIFNEAGAATLPALTAPSGPTHLSGATQFAWSAGTGGTAYYLRIGTLGAGSSDVLQSGSLPLTTTSKSVSIPAHGATLYVRLGYQVSGSWQSTDYTFTEAGTATAPTLTAPSGPAPLSGATQFTWSPGAGLTGFYLRVGTTGPGTTDIYHSGTLASTVTSESVTIPSNGAKVFVRLGYEANGVWSFVDYTFNEAGAATLPALTAPSGPAHLSGATQFAWSAGTGGTAYYLRIGTLGAGSSDVSQSGSLPLTTTSKSVSIPAHGATLYVRLGYQVSGTWQSTDYTFTEAGTATAPTLTAPSGPSPLSGATQFTWSPGAGLTGFYLRVGTTGAGSTDLYHSGTLASTVTSESVTIPSNGAKVYVRLGYEANGAWSFVDYTFTEGGSATAPALTAPSGPTPLSGLTSFTWTPGAGATQFRLKVSAMGPGQTDIYDSAPIATSVVSENVTIPSNGHKLYVRLAYYADGAWLYTDYTFTEAP